MDDEYISGEEYKKNKKPYEKPNRSLKPLMIKLRPTLDNYLEKRGDILKDDLILSITGELSPGLMQAIRNYFKARGIKISHRPSPVEGFIIYTDYEQSGQMPRGIRLGTKKFVEGYHYGKAVDCSKLTEKQLKSHEHHLNLIENIVQKAIGWRAESQFILKGKSRKELKND